MSAKTVIVVRKDLGLSKGKLIAQAMHAGFRAIQVPLYTSPYRTPGYSNLHKDSHFGPDTVDYKDTSQLPVCIVCYVKSERALMKLYERATGMVRRGLQIDAGHNEVPSGTKTVLCLGPTRTKKEEEFLNEITKNLQLLKD